MKEALPLEMLPVLVVVGIFGFYTVAGVSIRLIGAIIRAKKTREQL